MPRKGFIRSFNIFHIPRKKRLPKFKGGYINMFDFFNLYAKGSDPMGIVLFTYPLIVFVLSLIMELILKKKVGILLINFVFWLILTFTVLNSSFLIYCFIYTVISFLGTLMADLIISMKNKFINGRKA